VGMYRSPGLILHHLSRKWMCSQRPVLKTWFMRRQFF